jgi:cytoskeletal protein CcmA (bactofilin family)
VQIRGEVKGSEDLMVDGHVEGTITLLESRLTIGPNAHVAANVSAKDVIVLGHLIGSVSATGRVELRDGCDLVGDISAGRLSIEEKAVFRGKVEPLQGEKAGGVAPAKGAEVPVATSPANH